VVEEKKFFLIIMKEMNCYDVGKDVIIFYENPIRDSGRMKTA